MGIGVHCNLAEVAGILAEVVGIPVVGAGIPDVLVDCMMLGQGDCRPVDGLGPPWPQRPTWGRGSKPMDGKGCFTFIELYKNSKHNESARGFIFLIHITDVHFNLLQKLLAYQGVYLKSFEFTINNKRNLRNQI